MKKITFSRILASVLICPLLILSGCGTGEGPDTFVDSDSVTGGVGFSLKWQTPETLLNKPLNLAAPKIDCAAMGITTVTVSVYASNNNHLNGKDFPCSDGQGLVGGIPAQTGVKVTVEGKNDQGEALYKGEKGDIAIISGVVVDAGVITMLSIPSSASSITAFSIDGAAGTINEEAKSISVHMPYGTDTGSLIATFTTTGTGVQMAGVAQTSGVTVNNFSANVLYTVTAADGTSSGYTVTVTMPLLSPEKRLTAFSIDGAAGVIDEAKKTILLNLPYGTNLSALIATFTTTGASVQIASAGQISGVVANDFTGPVVYTVTAADGTSSDYTVMMTVALSSSKEITAYTLSGVSGAINEEAKSITVQMSYGTDTGSLIATFTTTGTGVQVAGVDQTSGVTVNNFSTNVV